MKDKGKMSPKKAAARVTDQDLQPHAETLARVLRALRSKNASVTSELLWKNAKQRWTADELAAAVGDFKKSGSVKRFTVLIRPLPKAGKEGFFTYKGEEWGTENALANKLDLDKGTIRPRLIGCRALQGLDAGGHLRRFFSLKDVEEACSDLLQEIPWADDEGFFSLKDELWGLLKPLARRTGISHLTIKRRLSEYRSVIGKDIRGHRETFYALNDVERVNVLLIRAQKADGTGLLKRNQQQWGTIESLARHLRLSTPTIRSIIGSCRTVQGKNGSGMFCTFYSLVDVANGVRRLQQLSRANNEGFLMIRDLCGTAAACARRLGLEPPTVRSRIAKMLVRKNKGRDQGGREATFYRCSDVERACMDLLIKKGLRKGVSEEVLKKHASILAKVLYRLRTEKAEVTFDKLWRLLETRWNEEMFKEAIHAFKSKGDITAFLKLLG